MGQNGFTTTLFDVYQRRVLNRTRTHCLYWFFFGFFFRSLIFYLWYQIFFIECFIFSTQKYISLQCSLSWSQHDKETFLTLLTTGGSIDAHVLTSSNGSTVIYFGVFPRVCPDPPAGAHRGGLNTLASSDHIGHVVSHGQLVVHQTRNT